MYDRKYVHRSRSWICIFVLINDGIIILWCILSYFILNKFSHVNLPILFFYIALLRYPL